MRYAAEKRDLAESIADQETLAAFHRSPELGSATAGAPDRSFYFDNQPNMLDQFMVNKNMATGDAAIRWTKPRCRSSRHRP
jgi:hypothetical protein